MPVKPQVVLGAPGLTLAALQAAGLPATSIITDPGTGNTVDATWSRALTAQEWVLVFTLFHPDVAKPAAAQASAAAIPSWATYTSDQAVAAIETAITNNVTLAAATTALTNATTVAQLKPIIQSLINGLYAADDIAKKEAQLIIALRDAMWPTLGN